MSSRLLIPLLNKSVTTFKGPTWYLGDNISVDSLNQEEQGLIFAEVPDQYKALIPHKPKAIRITGVDPSTCDKTCKDTSISASFVLNYFRREHPITTSFAMQITERRKSHLDRIIDIGSPTSAPASQCSPFAFRDGTDRATVTEFHKVVAAACQKHPGVLLPLTRFNSALARPDKHDQIVDLTISLEALIGGTTELRHRFAMHNAWAAEPNPKKRVNVLKALLGLYDARSAIVHGTSMTEKEYKRKIQPVVDTWADLLNIAASAIGYHVLYLYTHDPKTWPSHQIGLCLGAENRVTE